MDLVSLVKTLKRQRSEVTDSSESNIILFENTGISGAVFPVEGGGRFRQDFRNVSDEDLTHFLDHGVLPIAVMNKQLEAIGIGEMYHDIDPTQIRGKDLLDPCIRSMIRGDKRGFVLMGKPGVGKTTALAYTAQTLLVRIDQLTTDDIGFMAHVSLKHLVGLRKFEDFDRLARIRFLIIDDLGRCPDAIMEASHVENLLTERYNHKRSTMFSTNLDGPKLRAMNYWLADRLADKKWIQEVIIMGGESQRGQKGSV